MCVHQFAGGLEQIMTPLGLVPTQSPGYLDSLSPGFLSLLFQGLPGVDQPLFVEQMIWWE